MAYSYDRTAYNQPTEIAQKWAGTFKRALQKSGMKIERFDLQYAGNVRSYLEVKLNGMAIPLITIEEEKVDRNFNRLKWVRVDYGSNAKFIKAPTQMAQYVMDKYLL